MPDFQTNINIHETINSGQVFLWENYKNTWFGIDGYNVIVVKQKPSKILTLSKDTKNFFRSDDEFKKILKSILTRSYLKTKKKNEQSLIL